MTMAKTVVQFPHGLTKNANVCRDDYRGYAAQSDHISRSTLNPSLPRPKPYHAPLDAEHQNPYSTQKKTAAPHPLQKSQEGYSPMERWRQETSEEAPWNNVKAFAALPAQSLESKGGDAIQEQKQRSWSTQNENGSMYE